MNIDKVYQVENFVLPGETILADGIQLNVGGKGLNQSVAAARAGACVVHAGAVGEDGAMLTDFMKDAGVDISQIQVLPGQSGHAIIQVDSTGHNCITSYMAAPTVTLLKNILTRFLQKRESRGTLC